MVLLRGYRCLKRRYTPCPDGTSVAYVVANVRFLSVAKFRCDVSGCDEFHVYEKVTINPHLLIGFQGLRGERTEDEKRIADGCLFRQAAKFVFWGWAAHKESD